MAPRSSARVRRLPVRRRIRPLQQGDLDGLCGVYAIVNAIRWLCPTLSEGQSKELFGALIDAREQRPMRRPLSFVHRGLTRVGLARMVDTAIIWAANVPALYIEAEWLAPPERRRDSLAKVWQRLERQIGPGAVAIVGLGKASDHWTVAVEASPRQLTLLDSDGMSILRRERCLPRRAGGVHYDLQLRWVLVMRRLRPLPPVGEVLI